MPEYPLSVERSDGGIEGFAVWPEFERNYATQRVICGR
jgi:hypothetical protein